MGGILTSDNLHLWILGIAVVLVHRVVRFAAVEFDNAQARRRLLERVVEKRLSYLQRLAEQGVLKSDSPAYEKLTADAASPDGFDVDIVDEEPTRQAA